MCQLSLTFHLPTFRVLTNHLIPVPSLPLFETTWGDFSRLIMPCWHFIPFNATFLLFSRKLSFPILIRLETFLLSFFISSLILHFVMGSQGNDPPIFNQTNAAPFPIQNLHDSLLSRVFCHMVHEGEINAFFSLMCINHHWREIANSPLVLREITNSLTPPALVYLLSKF